MGIKQIFIIIYSILLVMTLMADSYSNYPIKPIKNSNGPLIKPSDRILIIAPHPDDEAICNAGVIHYCVENNIPVKVVVVTDGDIGRGLTKQRHDESVKAMQILGLNLDDLIFLGYHDTNLPQLLTKNWDYNNPYPVYGEKTNINYPFSYQKNATYCGANLEQNLEDIMFEFQPTVILYPDSEDEQIDHWATNTFVEYAAARLNYEGNKYTYIVHYPPNWPTPHIYNPESYLTPPKELSQLGVKWVVFPLDTYQERLKDTAINTYTSQVNSDSYVQSFIRKNELFGINPDINTTTSNQSLDFFSNPNFPDTIIKEPLKEDRGKGSIRTREITELGFKIGGNKTWISLRTNCNLSSSKYYEIHIISFNGDKIERMDIHILNGTANYGTYNENSFKVDEPIKMQIKDGGCVIQIPSTIFEDAEFFLITSDIKEGTNMIDWTAWRRINIVR